MSRSNNLQIDTHFMSGLFKNKNNCKNDEYQHFNRDDSSLEMLGDDTVGDSRIQVVYYDNDINLINQGNHDFQNCGNTTNERNERNKSNKRNICNADCDSSIHDLSDISVIEEKYAEVEFRGSYDKLIINGSHDDSYKRLSSDLPEEKYDLKKKLYRMQSQFNFITSIFQFRSIRNDRNYKTSSILHSRIRSKKFQLGSNQWEWIMKLGLETRVSSFRGRIYCKIRGILIGIIRQMDTSSLSILQIVSSLLKLLTGIQATNLRNERNQNEDLDTLHTNTQRLGSREERRKNIVNMTTRGQQKGENCRLMTLNVKNRNAIGVMSSIFPSGVSNILKFTILPLIFQSCLTLVQIFFSIRLSQKSAKLTRSLIDHRFRSFTKNILEFSMLSTVAAFISSTKQSHSVWMKTELFLKSMETLPLDSIHYELQKAKTETLFDSVWTFVEGILELVTYSIALGRLSGFMAPTILVSYVALQKLVFSIMNPSRQYQKLHSELSTVIMSLSEKLWNDENTDASFYENLIPGHSRNTMEEYLHLFSSFCSIQLRISKLDTIYKHIFGRYLKKNMPFIISWTYTAILAILGNLKFLTHAELSSLFSFMNSLVLHQILACYKVSTFLTRIKEIKVLNQVISDWEDDNIRNIEIHNKGSDDFEKTLDNLSLSSISVQAASPSKNNATMLDALRCANVGLVPNLQSTLVFTPAKESQITIPLNHQQLSYTINIQRSAEWIINFCVRTDYNLLVTCQKSNAYELLFHRITLVANMEGILCCALFSHRILPETTLRTFFNEGRNASIHENISDASIDRVLTELGLNHIIEFSYHDFNIPFSQWKIQNFRKKDVQMLYLAQVLYQRPVFCLLDTESVDALSKKEWNLVKQNLSSHNIIVVLFSRFLTDDVFVTAPSVISKDDSHNSRDTLWRTASLDTSSGTLIIQDQEMETDDINSSPIPRQIKSLHTDVATETTILELDGEMQQFF